MNMFGDYLKLHRTNSELSLRQLAELLSVDPSILSRLERGEIAVPSEEVLMNLPAALKRSRPEVYVAAGRITPELAQQIAVFPSLLEQVAKVLAMTEEQLAEHSKTLTSEQSIADLATGVDKALVDKTMGVMNDLAEIVQHFVNGRVSQERFEHVAALVGHMKVLALTAPTDKGTP